MLAPPPPAVRAGGAGGLVLPEETAAHASETLAYSGISVRHVDNSIRKGAFEGELSSGASVLRVSVQQFRAAADGAADELVSPTSGRAGRVRRWGMSGSVQCGQGSGGEATARV